MQHKKGTANWRHRLKQVVLAWMMVLVFAVPIAGVVMIRPQPVLAQGAPVSDIAQLIRAIGVYLEEKVAKGLYQGSAIAFKNALKVFVSQIAYDTAVWIGSGGENQQPLLFTTDVGAYLTNVGDAAAGEFLNTLFSENGYFSLDLCSPTDVNVQLYLGLAIGLALPNVDYLGIQLPSGRVPGVECTFSEITENFQESSLDADFATQVALIFVPSNNDFGVYSTALGVAYNTIAAEKEEAVIERQKGDFLSVDGKISGYIGTPSSAVEHQYFLSLDASSYPQTTYTGQLLADTIDIFTSTLISKLLQRLKTGLIADFTTIDIADSLSGSSSTTGGVKAAEEKYLSFQDIPITRGGDLDILSDLANCPDQGKEVTNCVIDEGFRSAIEQGKTVQQALEEGLIDGGKPFGFGEGGLPIESAEEGIQYRSTIVLKHYRIVPVGWQIAAEYLRDFGGGTSITLQDLVDAYDQCDSTNYSPYCKLVDPDWVLTSPAGICNLQGFGQNILSVRFEDDDGLAATPERSNLLRSQSCVDDQTCLQTDSDGNCIAYGYCTQEKRIYRFQGDECPDQYSSCQTYLDSDGDEVSYLRNTLNFNNCDINSVGCQWYCSVYNDISLDWQCSQNGYVYETCSSSSSTYDASNETCTCTASDATTCEVLDGAFKCSTDSGTICTLSEVADSSVADQDSSINFNNQVTTCSEDDIGCTTFLQTTTGANLIFNSSFEYFNSFSETPGDNIQGEDELTDTTIDTFGFYSADASDPGAACAADSGTDDCIGWETSGNVYGTNDDVEDGFVAAELQGVATLTYELETGYALADRTFDLAFISQNTGSTDCRGEVTLNGALLENLDYTGAATFNLTYTGDDTWTTNTFEAYTYPATTTDTELSLNITVPAACTATIKFDQFDLTETDDASDYTAYSASEEISMNGDRVECAVEEVGCEEFTPAGGSEDDAIPGQITNPLSDACTGTEGFEDPSCSQCNGTTSDDEFVGCDFYQEQPLAAAAPVPSLAGFTTLPTGDEREGIVQRTGYYCNNSGYEGVSCYDDSDCGGTAGACVDSTSIIPSTAQTCSASYVGCEEYTNLDVVTEGGEGLEYYSYIKQCVKDTPEQRDNDEIKTYVTFEGSDVSGYSLRSFDLKKSNLDDGPCTNLDLYGSTAQSSEADCIDTSSNQQTCTAADVGVDADCTEFIDPDSGTSYYRLDSYTISASDDCHPLRNELDGRTYYSIPSESTECPASQNLCREYKGSAGGDVFEVMNEDFEDDVWDQVGSTGTVEQSSESTAAGGHSLHLSGGSAAEDLFVTGDEGTFSFLEEGQTYVIEFWAKQDGGGTGLDVYFYSATSTSTDASVYFVENSVNSISGDAVSLDTDWHKYTFGPVIFPREGEEDDQLIIGWSDTTDVYVDNIVLEESDAQYLIKGTADSCAGYEGCEEYSDRAGETHYIKSFIRLCEEQYVGCEALVDTQNSDSPFTQEFHADNDFTSASGPDDDVTVAEDQVVFYVNDEDNYCTQSQAGCTEYGQPDLDDTTGYVDSFTSVTYLNDPDSYDTILCETDALTCDEYTSSGDEVEYFKNPGDRTCEYRQETDGSDFAWFIVGTDVACPLFDDADSPGQPQGALCEGGTRDGLFCVSDDDCPDDDPTDTDEPHCRSDLTTDADADGYPDAGWTGICSSAYSGCTEYQDTNTNNLISNGGFEEDVYTYTNGETDESAEASDGRPDYFENFSFFACDTLAQNSSESHTGVDSLEVAQDGLFSSGDGIGCSVIPEDRIEIDTTKTYTLSANVMVPNAFSGSNVSLVSLGLYYYDADGNFLSYDYDGDGQAGNVEDYEEFNVAAAGETISSDENGVWLRYSGQVGNRLEMIWPSVDNVWGGDVASVLPFVYVYTPSGQALYVDNFSLTENAPYFYINDSVDGTPENDQNTCNGEVDRGDGCVVFRDVTDKDLTYLSGVESEVDVNSDFSVSSCTIGATDSEDENCRFNADTADGNVVLQVRPDRECNQWLTCETASITTDDEGNEVSTCYEIDLCDELSDSGACVNHLTDTLPEELDATSDLTFRSRAGSTSQLDFIQNLSGYSKAGVKWDDDSGTCDTTEGECSDGPNIGQECTSDDDCTETIRTQGFYPFEDMPQEGEDGLTGSGGDLITDGDFEAIACGGTGTATIDLGTISMPADQAFFFSRNQNQTCTIDDHCRNQDTDARLKELQSIDERDESVDLSDTLDYSAGWCSNPDEAGEGYGDNWEVTGSSLMSIIDFDPTIEFENPATGVFDPPVAPNAATSLDLNNVLYVEPTGAGQGVTYTLENSIIVIDGEFTLSFDMAYAQAPTSNDFLQAGIEYTDDDGNTTQNLFHLCDTSGSCGDTTSFFGTSSFAKFTAHLDATNKEADATSSQLFILAGSGSDATPFYLDNVSMLPTLGVNTQLDTIARECRAYPAENAALCNYTDPNGSIFSGIHGYCLEHDGLFQDKCVTWWPVDSISGDTDTRSKDVVRYEGRVPLYYCAVAKGLQDLAVCDGGDRDGAICTDYLFDLDANGAISTNNSNGDNEFETGDEYCAGSSSTGSCTFGEGVRLSADVSGSGNPTSPDSAIYHQFQENGGWLSSRGVETNEQGYQSVSRAFNFYLSGQGDSSGEGFLFQNAANPVEQVLTLSDIYDITIEPTFNGSIQIDGEWPEVNAQFTLGDETDDGGEPNGTSISGSTVTGVDINAWDDGGGVVGKKCEWINHDIDADGNGTIKWVWTANYNPGTPTDPTFCTRDPFNIPLDHGADAARNGDLSDDDDYDFYGWSTSSSPDLPSSLFIGETENLVAMQFTFEDGALASVQHFVHSEIDGDNVEALFIVKYSLQETCAYIVQAVDSSGLTTPWMERINDSANGYILPDTNFAYDIGPEPYGAILPLTGVPDSWNADGDFAWNGSDNGNGNPSGGLVIDRTSDTDLTAAPLACVGRCEQPMCAGYDEVTNDPSYQTCPSNETDYTTGNACSNESLSRCTGAAATTSSSFPNSGAGTVGTNEFGEEVTDFNDQLFAAALVAKEDLKYIFAKLSSEDVYTRGFSEAQGHMRNSYNKEDAEHEEDLLWNNSSSEDIYTTMPECSSSTRSSTDYCGIRPEVSGITINSQRSSVTIADGESVTLRFGMSADENQEPVNNLNIMFEGIQGLTWDSDTSAEIYTNNWGAAASDDIAFSHAYTCDSDSSNWESEDDSDGDGYAGVCIYEIRIQIEDNWEFCSGRLGDDSDTDYRSADNTACTSYDQFGGYIIVEPD